MGDNEVMDALIDACEIIFNIKREDILSDSRKHKLTDARAIIYTISRLHYKIKLEKIGNHFNKNHATIIHGIKTLKNDYYLDFIRSKFKSVLRVLDLPDPYDPDEKFYTYDDLVEEIKKIKGQNADLRLSNNMLKNKLKRHEIQS